MALTGLQIQKLLPGTNCKECGSNTCLAFAMKLAAKKAAITECPYASDDAKQTLGLANEPPVKTIGLGPEKKLITGGETVLYRHDKTFVNRTILAVNIDDDATGEEIDATLAQVRDYVLERVGETLTVEMIGLTQRSTDAASFAALAGKAWQSANRPLILRGLDTKALSEAAKAVSGSGSIVAAHGEEQFETLLPVIKECGHTLALSAPDLDALAGIAGKLRADGLSDLLLAFVTHGLAEQFQTNTIARRAAIKDNFKALGFPFLHFISGADPFETTAAAVSEVTKYGGICVLPGFDPAQLSALMTLRQNIFTDPQKPIQVEPKLYSIGDPKPDAPVFVTTNFSLTFFIVSGEVENSGISAWLLVPECEGMSVLTAWAAGKFSAATISKFMQEIDLESQITSRRIVIPGYVASISGELEDNLPGWKVMVGPEEAADLEGFIKTYVQ